jgi:hypothetical protein
VLGGIVKYVVVSAIERGSIVCEKVMEMDELTGTDVAPLPGAYPTIVGFLLV